MEGGGGGGCGDSKKECVRKAETSEGGPSRRAQCSVAAVPVELCLYTVMSHTSTPRTVSVCAKFAAAE